MNKSITFYLFPLMIFTVLLSCNSIEPPTGLTINLTLEDVSCTEAWITLTSNIKLPATIELKQNQQVVKTINLNSSDSLIFIESLLPNNSYTFQATNSAYRVTSSQLQLTTLDTTNHNFTFETFTFGEHSSSVLYDVAIINENSIYAVGAIYMNDTLGQQDPNAYGVAVWDGQTWKLKRLFNDTGIPVTPRGILVLKPNEIYLAAGSIFRWDGISTTVQMVYSRFNLSNPNGTIEKLWGNSSSSIYGVGNVGSIVYYNGSNWAQVASGTDVMLNSMSGESSAGETWISGYNPTGNHHSILLLVEDLTSAVIWEAQNLVETPPYGFNIQSICSFNDLLFVASDEGIFRKNTRLDLSPQRISSNPVWKYKITGTDQNDVFCVGDNSIITHYNGMETKIIHQIFGNTSVLYSATASNNTMVSVGTLVIDVVYHKAQIILTKRL